MIVSADQVEEIEIASKRTGEKFGKHRMVSITCQLQRLLVSKEVLPPRRNSSSPHYHTTKEEVIYVLSGRPTLMMDGQKSCAKEGDFIVFKPGDDAFHQLRNDTDEECVFLVSAAGMEDDQTVYGDR